MAAAAAADGVDIPVRLEDTRTYAADHVHLYNDPELDRAVGLEELVQKEYDVFNPRPLVRRLITCLDVPPLPAPVPVELDGDDAYDQQQVVALEASNAAVMLDIDLARFERLHENDHNNRGRTRRGGRRGGGGRRRGGGSGTSSAADRLRSRSVMSALSTHVVTRDKDDARIEYEGVAIRSRAEADSVGVQYVPQRVTTFILRRRRKMTGARQSIYMTPGDWLTVRSLTSDKTERAQVKGFRPFRRYKSQRVADTAAVDVTRVDNA